MSARGPVPSDCPVAVWVARGKLHYRLNGSVGAKRAGAALLALLALAYPGVVPWLVALIGRGLHGP